MSKEKILIVDDAMLMRNLLKNILKSKGYEVCGEALTGEDGVKMYKELRPNLVICDINMPGMNGIECLRQILAINPAAKIVMCTSMGERCFAEEAVDAGAKGYIVKPVAAAAVIETVTKVLSEKNYKDMMMDRALAEGMNQKDILDFFGAVRSIVDVDLGDKKFTKEFLKAKKENIAIGAEAFLSAKMPLEKVNKLVSVFNSICEEA